MQNFHFSFFGILLYSLTILLLSPFQKEMLSTQEWQLQSIQRKNQSLPQLDPGLVASEHTMLAFDADGTFTAGADSGTWTLRGKILNLELAQETFPFRIYQLSPDKLLLKTWVDNSCVSLLFLSQ